MNTEGGSPKYIWPGLAPYQEADNGLFYGRANEISDLSRKIIMSKLIILFGPSGAGKTSLLQAGIFPVLVERKILPVPIRIEFNTQNHEIIPIIELLKPSLEQESIKRGINLSYHSSQWFDSRKDQLTLWEWLKMVSLTDQFNEIWQPLFIFDQFEEIFTVGKQAKGIEDFLQQLGDAAENFLPQEISQILNSSDDDLPLASLEHNCKFLFSIREDYFAQLQAFRNVLPRVTVRQNYFPLGMLNGNQALEAILGPAPKGLISDQVAHEIVQFVAKATETVEHDSTEEINIDKVEVEPAILSLVCQQLNSKRIAEGQKEITLDFIRQTKEQILKEYYDSIIVKVEQKTRDFIEDNLLDAEGFRTSEPESNFKSNQINQLDIQALVNQRVLHHIEQYGRSYYELSHDVLVPVVRKSRETRQFQEIALKRQKEITVLRIQRRRILLVSITLGLLFLASFTAFLYGIYQKNKAVKSEKQAVEAKNRAVESEQKARKAKVAADSAFNEASIQKTRAEASERTAKEEQFKAINARIIAENELYRNIKNSLSVSAEAMNVLYAGIQNPVTITVSGIPSEKLSFEIENGSIQKGKVKNSNGVYFDGDYVIMPDYAGKNVILTIYGETKAGKKDLIGHKEFRIKNLQAPYASFAGKTSGILLKDKALETIELKVELQTDFNIEYKISGFALMFTDKYGDHFEESLSNNLTKYQLRLIQACTHGAYIAFTNIKAKGYDSKIIDLPPLVFKIYSQESAINSLDDKFKHKAALDFSNYKMPSVAIDILSSIEKRKPDDMIDELVIIINLLNMASSVNMDSRIASLKKQILDYAWEIPDIDSSLILNTGLIGIANNIITPVTLKIELPDFILELSKKLLLLADLKDVQRQIIYNLCSSLSSQFFYDKKYSWSLSACQVSEKAYDRNQKIFQIQPLIYLFNDSINESEKIYEEWKNKPIEYPLDSKYKEVFLEDIEYLESRGITHPDFAKVKELLKK